MDEKDRIRENLSAVFRRISKTAKGCGRDPEAIRLVAVGKTQPIEFIRHAIISGADIIGENYIQEAREKFAALVQHDTRWHFIGHLQRNKAKYAVRMFDLIHSVDSLKLAHEINKQAHKINKKQSILVQVNLSGESSKSGAAESQTQELVEQAQALDNLQIRGLMTMPPFFDAPEKARPYFAALRKLRDRLENRLAVELKDLSMGMTGDFEVAIDEGATLVRIGTAIFGERR